MKKNNEKSRKFSELRKRAEEKYHGHHKDIKKFSAEAYAELIDELESEQRFASVAKTANDAIISANMSGEIVQWNKASEKMFGFTADEIMGKSLTAIMPERYQTAHLKGLERVVKTGKTRITDRVIELAGLRRDGTEFPLELTLAKWETREGLFFTAIIRDITERVKTEEVLRKSQDRVAGVLESIKDGFFALDNDFILTYFNKAAEKLLGLKSDDIIGKHMFDEVFPEAKGTIFEKKYRWALQENKPVAFEAYFPAEPYKNWYEVRVFPYDDGLSIYFQVITDRKRAESERENLMASLKAKNEELEHFSRIIRHDFGNPILSINAFVNELVNSYEQLTELLDEENIAEEIKGQLFPILKDDIPCSIGFIQDATKQMNTLLEGLKHISAIGRTYIDIEMLDMNKLIKETTDAMKHQFQDSKVSSIIDPLPECLGDAGLVKRLFINLLTNAMKYSAPDRKGQIYISGKVEEDHSIYCVEDNGIGIKPGNRKKIFDVFYRVDSSGPASGEGMGLSIVARILERLDGRIWVESEFGKGSRFYVALPHLKY